MNHKHHIVFDKSFNNGKTKIGYCAKDKCKSIFRQVVEDNVSKITDLGTKKDWVLA